MHTMKNLIEVINVKKYLSGALILDDISFSVSKWQIYGFLWPNWAWKTTTMKCIMGLIDPEEWEIKVFWDTWLNLKAKEKIGFMPENTYLYRHLTGYELLEFNWNFFKIGKEKLNKRIDDLLKRVWLSDAKDVPLRNYSKWMLQRIWLAQALINDPELVFLDEPMSWLDPLGRKMIKDIMVDLKKRKKTVFFNTHILADVESVCDSVSIIHKGKIIVESKNLSTIRWSLENFFIKSVKAVDSIVD